MLEKRLFYKKKTFIDMMQTVKNNGGDLHIMGLLSDGGVHSHINQLYAIIDKAKEMGLKKDLFDYHPNYKKI